MMFRKALCLVLLIILLMPVASFGADIGDIVLSDGTVAKSAELNVLDEDNLPVAVIAGVRQDGSVFGVGVHRSETPLSWAEDNSVGYSTKFTGIISTLNAENGNASSVVFSGDMDGSDNWNVIRLIDKKGSADVAKNYPAFDFVNTYSARYNLTGDYASEWYMPSIAELCIIYKNRNIVNASLQKIHELNKNASMDGLGTNWYWSSSQSEIRDSYVWFVHYFNGYTCDCPKNFTNLHVIAIRAF